MLKGTAHQQRGLTIGSISLAPLERFSRVCSFEGDNVVDMLLNNLNALNRESTV